MRASAERTEWLSWRSIPPEDRHRYCRPEAEGDGGNLFGLYRPSTTGDHKGMGWQDSRDTFGISFHEAS